VVAWRRLRPAASGKLGFIWISHSSSFGSMKNGASLRQRIGSSHGTSVPRGDGQPALRRREFAWNHVRVIDFHSVSSFRLDQELRRLRREETRCLLRRAQWSDRQLEASVCSFDARCFGTALSNTEIALESRVSEELHDLQGVAFRRCTSEVSTVSAGVASGSRRSRATRRAELARFEV
jgi:hypothetical protein